MRQGASLNLSMRTTLKLSPSARLALELLQTPALELHDRIQREILANPLLEIEDGVSDDRVDDDSSALPATAGESDETAMSPNESASPGDDGYGDAHGDPHGDTNEEGPEGGHPDGLDDRRGDAEENFHDDGPDEACAGSLAEWSVAAAPRGVLEEAKAVERERVSVLPLTESLLCQLRLEVRDEETLARATYLIGCLDERGYLAEPWEAISADMGVEPESLLPALRALQGLDPAGIGARDLSECLALQLERGGLGETLAARIVGGALGDLAAGRHAALLRRFHVTPEALEAALAEIRRLDPHPGRAFAPEPPRYVLPDLVVRRDGEGWEIRLGSHAQPTLRIQTHYRGLAESSVGSAGDFLRGRLRDARWLVGALDRRRATMVRVMEAIVDAQEEFFAEGPRALRPLTLQEIASGVGLHESTVARVAKDKYVDTPRGIFPLRFFFSSRISTQSGPDTSARAVKARIRALVEAEKSDRPLSDRAIVRSLETEGIRIARRTVAKYRDQMKIARAQLRRRAGSRESSLPSRQTA
ncbi:MAG: RNA polymerase factor sigma-54 [Candidatus Eisenbacteria bacterium]|uniref:RNA polymerase factor sigma-54 n=1 Tax=Eiseniibacteriota bacterium TaxID=2212470 RepID=A0A956RPE5_UNCEI|nr:RNA polymerase factor sigma-54 [Candidatus Eisenbacteria bacterium]